MLYLVQVAAEGKAGTGRAYEEDQKSILICHQEVGQLHVQPALQVRYQG